MTPINGQELGFELFISSENNFDYEYYDYYYTEPSFLKFQKIERVFIVDDERREDIWEMSGSTSGSQGWQVDYQYEYKEPDSLTFSLYLDFYKPGTMLYFNDVFQQLNSTTYMQNLMFDVNYVSSNFHQVLRINGTH